MNHQNTKEYTTIITASELKNLTELEKCKVVDCRFSLADTEAGRKLYLDGHIPGATYAHLDEFLSNPATTDHGRHPLPPAEVLSERFAQIGIDSETQVVAYDAVGAMIAPRLWWLLRYMGHRAVAVLDGGIKAWTDAGFSTEPGQESNAVSDSRAGFGTTANPAMFITADAVPHMKLLVDSRGHERYTGESEPIDKKAGHIPGAVSSPFAETLNSSGLFLSSDKLRTRFETLLGSTLANDTAFYCGSGVTACVNLLAMCIAGIPMAKLYAGSWSDWSSDPNRKAATGSTPE